MFSDGQPQLEHPQNVPLREQRRHIRVEHSTTVHIIGEGQRFSGRAVNISRSGMRVVLTVPDSYRSVRSITFELPRSGKQIELPCRVVHDRQRVDHDGARVLGLEFSYQAEAQLLLIENFIQELKRSELTDSSGNGEMRSIPRADCSISGVTTDRPGAEVLSIDNISTEGLLISARGELEPEQPISLAFLLPGDGRRLQVAGRVTYVIRNEFSDTLSAGVRLTEAKETVQARIRSFIAVCTSSAAIRSLYERASRGGVSCEYAIGERKRILGLFRQIQHEAPVINVLFEDHLAIYESTLERLEESTNRFQLRLATSGGGPLPCGPEAYFTYTNGGGHYFKSCVVAGQKDLVTFALPQLVFQTEKRCHRRKNLATDRRGAVRLHLETAPGVRESLEGRLADISRRGFLCELTVPPSLLGLLAEGRTVHYEIDSRWALPQHGQIRHAKVLDNTPRGVRLQIGVEAGILRSGYTFRKIGPREWDEMGGGAAPAAGRGRFDSRRVEYRNQHGQRIAALVNSTAAAGRAPVVVLPPGFGKKKETLAPLVSTLLTNFALHGRELVTVRFDGINRPGESHNDAAEVKRGYEMLRYRIGQGVQDLGSTLRYVHSNPLFAPGPVILVSFSMSAIDARRYLASESRPGADYWVSCMGVPSAQTTLQRIFGGIDIVGNCKMGIRNGVMGMLGHVVDMDVLARDLVENGYAYMTETRRDMARIGAPVLWIYGTHDKWVEVEEVIDTMSIGSSADREVVEVPTGHNLHTSEDALKAYKIITSWIYERLYGEPITAVDPDREEMLRLITYEREHLEQRTDIEARRYWKSYLIGEEGSGAGYDFYRNFAEFRDFLQTEARLIALKPGDRLADLGCGTGLLLEGILREAADRFPDREPAELFAVDLVPQALERTRRKCEALTSAVPNLGSVTLRTVALNLEPNRLLPVHYYLRDPDSGYAGLRNRIRGFKNVHIDTLIKHDCGQLRQLMRGRRVPESRDRRMRAVLGGEAYRAVVDFNRAARFLLGTLTPADLAPGKRRTAGGKAPDPTALRTGDLEFAVLDFGDCGRELTYPFAGGSFSKVVASLFLSYLLNPDYAVAEFYRLLQPGGTVLISTMKPDSDVSLMFTNYTGTARPAEGREQCAEQTADLRAARHMLHEAAGLFELEEEGYFKFFTTEELAELCRGQGFESIEVHRSLGHPPQAIIVIARKPSSTRRR